jgi:hypothetical protein
MPRSTKTPTLDRGCLSLSFNTMTYPHSSSHQYIRHAVSPRTQKQRTSPSRPRDPGHQGAMDDDLVSPALSAFSQPLQGHLATSENSNHCLLDGVSSTPSIQTLPRSTSDMAMAILGSCHGLRGTLTVHPLLPPPDKSYPLSRPSRNFDVHPLLPPPDEGNGRPLM